MAFTRTMYQEIPTSFDTSTWYTHWDSRCTKYINPYLDLYIEYSPLDTSNTTQVNAIGGLIKTQGIGTIVL